MTPTSSAWTSRDLARFGDADELEISTRRPDGSLRSSVPIWVVVAGGALYVRSYRGAEGAWYRRAAGNSAGVIRVPGRSMEVAVARGRHSRARAGAVGATLRLDTADCPTHPTERNHP